MKNSLSPILPLVLMKMLAEETIMRRDPDEPKLPPPPPWVTARYDIPKSQRKGKSLEEIDNGN